MSIVGACLLVGPPLVLVMLQPDLGTSLVFGAILAGMLWMSGASLRWLIVLAVGVIAMVPIAWTYLLRDYQKARLTAFLNANPDIQGAGFQLHQAQIAVGAGGLIGKGLTNGTQTQGDLLPVQATDFVFATLAEELGFIGGIVMFVLFVLLLWRVLVAGWRSRDAFGTLFAAGVASMILFQLVVNVGMVLGVMPITGIPLPFVTHGGASLVSMAAGLGHPPEHQHQTDQGRLVTLVDAPVTPGIDERDPARPSSSSSGSSALAVFVAILARPLRLPTRSPSSSRDSSSGIIANVAGYPPVDVSPELVLLVLLPGLVFEAAYRLRIVEIRAGSAGGAAGDPRRHHLGRCRRSRPQPRDRSAARPRIHRRCDGLRDRPGRGHRDVQAADRPASLSTMVDGESLLNDGTGLVLFAIAVGAVYQPIGPVEAVASFVGTIVISVGIGLVTGFVAARVIRLVADDHLLGLTITVVLAYGSYVLADRIGLSGVIATVTAGIVLGNVGPTGSRSAETSDAIDTVWEFIAYLLTAFVFLLVGLAIPPARLLDALGPIAWGIVGDPGRPGARRVRPPRWRVATRAAPRARGRIPRFVAARAVLGRSARGGGRGDGAVAARPTSRSGRCSRRSPSGSSCSRCSSRARRSAGSSTTRSARDDDAPDEAARRA